MLFIRRISAHTQWEKYPRVKRPEGRVHWGNITPHFID